MAYETTKGALKTANAVLSQKLIESEREAKALRREVARLEVRCAVFEAGVADLERRLAAAPGEPKGEPSDG